MNIISREAVCLFCAIEAGSSVFFLGQFYRCQWAACPFPKRTKFTGLSEKTSFPVYYTTMLLSYCFTLFLQTLDYISEDQEETDTPNPSLDTIKFLSYADEVLFFY
ncbi:hypothetical protein BY458DRAFT_486031 [Sporodiniella umbellata]|nr:hypothetical protein BY458DRAFT_486031 [Sporodiniella umbellata]